MIKYVTLLIVKSCWIHICLIYGHRKKILSENSYLSTCTVVYSKLSKVWQKRFFLKMFLLGILSLNHTIESKMALKSSLHINCLSRNANHYFSLSYQVNPKKCPWWTVPNSMPMFQTGHLSVAWKWSKVIQLWKLHDVAFMYEKQQHGTIIEMLRKLK